jgi:hypothetical protein
VAQRVHPIIYRLGAKTKLWDYKYSEKKTSEQPHTDFKNLELKKFTLKFFKDKGFEIHECRINYCSNGYLHIFLSCYKVLKKDFVGNKIIMDSIGNSIEKNLLTQQDYANYRVLNYTNKLLNRNYSEQKLIILKKKLANKYYKLNYFEENSNFIISSQTTNKGELSFFLNNFIESLIQFIGNKLTVILTFQTLTKTLKKNLDRKTIEFIQKKITRLNKYKQNNFFTEGINTLYICSKEPNSANLLAEFLAIQLKKNKKQYNKFFLNFIKKCLKSFKKENTLKTNNIKIQIKGRLSRGARAKKKVLSIANKLPILTIKASVDYSEKVAYTSNGTVGIKVWIYNQS